MKDYQKRLARLLAETGALFFQEGLRLKDGRPTPYFVNFGVLCTGRTTSELGRCFADWMAEEGLARKIDLVVGPSYKGSAIAQATAICLWRKHEKEVAFDYDRKEAKTHGEATGKGILFVTGAALKGGKALIIDDVGTSMATKLDLIKKLQWLKPRAEAPLDLQGVALAVDREQTMAVYDDQGRVREGVRGVDAIQAFREKTGLPVWSLIGIRQCVAYLKDEGVPVLVDGTFQALDAPTLERMDEYLAIYGREGA